MKRWNLFISEETLEKTQKLAKKKGLSAADIVRIALEKYHQAVERAENAAKEAANVR